jgi:hypothetical protein
MIEEAWREWERNNNKDLGPEAYWYNVLINALVVELEEAVPDTVWEWCGPFGLMSTVQVETEWDEERIWFNIEPNLIEHTFRVVDYSTDNGGCPPGSISALNRMNYARVPVDSVADILDSGCVYGEEGRVLGGWEFS